MAKKRNKLNSSDDTVNKMARLDAAEENVSGEEGYVQWCAGSV